MTTASVGAIANQCMHRTAGAPLVPRYLPAAAFTLFGLRSSTKSDIQKMKKMILVKDEDMILYDLLLASQCRSNLYVPTQVTNIYFEITGDSV